MEACVARNHITNAGEMNGFLKPSSHLLRSPLKAEAGAIRLDPCFAPQLDEQLVSRFTVGSERHAARSRARA